MVEGLSFHVGSQCTNFENFVQALEHRRRGHRRGRARAATRSRFWTSAAASRCVTTGTSGRSATLAGKINAEIDRLFPQDIEILAEPGRFLVATAATSVARVIGKAVRDGKTCYYIDDSVYHTYSGIIFDHCQYRVKAFKQGQTEICAVFGQTCDGLDTISQSEELPDLEIGDLVYSEDIGAYSNASATWFNGFPPARVVHVND